MVHEPMTDLVKLMGRLVDNDGTILIPGVDEMVPPPTPEELYVSSFSSPVTSYLAPVHSTRGWTIQLTTWRWLLVDQFVYSNQ